MLKTVVDWTEESGRSGKLQVNKPIATLKTLNLNRYRNLEWAYWEKCADILRFRLFDVCIALAKQLCWLIYN